MDEPRRRASQPHTITSTLESHPISRSLASMAKQAERAKLVAIQLAKLAQHYWRPDFTAMQAEALFGDFLEDLEPFDPEEIESTCRTYRQDSRNQFFPKPGQLRERLAASRTDALKMARAAAKPLHDSRPTAWWMRPRQEWKHHWRQSEIPHDYLEAYLRWEEAVNLKKSPERPAYVPGVE